MLSDESADLAGGLHVPDGGAGELEPGHVDAGVVVEGELVDVVAGGAQEIVFGAEDFVFAAGLLVEVVDEEDFHVVMTRGGAAGLSGLCWWIQRAARPTP